MARAFEATYVDHATPASGEFPSAPAIEPTRGGYVVAREAPAVRAWLRAGGLSVWRVLALSPEALWLDGDDVQGNHEPGPCELWLELAGERLGPLAASLGHAPDEPWFWQHDGRSVRMLTLHGAPAERLPFAHAILRLVEAGRAHGPSEGAPPPELLSERALVLDTLGSFAREGLTGSLVTPEGAQALRIVAIDAQRGRLLWQGDTRALASPGFVEFATPHALYQVPVCGLGPDDTTALPEWLTRSMRRANRRVGAPHDLTFCTAQHDGPLGARRYHVRDLSRGGFSFETGAEGALLYPGLLLEHAQLTLGTEPALPCRAQVRSVRRLAGGARVVVGLSFEPDGEAARLSLNGLLERALYPTTHTRAEDAWALNESSGYLKLSGKSPADFARFREQFIAASHKLERAPEIATVAYWPAAGRVEATVSHFRVYESSWLACQLSKLKARDALPLSRHGIRDMYVRIYETARADADTRWLLTYVQDAAPTWSKEIQVRVAQRFESSGEGCLVPFRALELDLTTRGLHGLPAVGARISAEPACTHAAIRDLARVRPAQYLDALDLTESRADLAQHKARWQAAGLARERALFVAYEGHVRMALAVVELAEPFVHIYGLLDCVRMYSLRPGGERTFGMLLAQARAWYLAHGRQRLVYLEECKSGVSHERTGFRDLGCATLSLLSIDRVPELLERAADLASQRPPARHSAAG